MLLIICSLLLSALTTSGETLVNKTRENANANRSRYFNQLNCEFKLKRYENDAQLIKKSFPLCKIQGYPSDKAPNSCVDPSDEKLNEILFNFERILDGAMNILKIDNLYRGHYRQNKSHESYSSVVFGSKICNKTSQLWIQERGLCPWHFLIKRRDDIYPRLQMNAVCNCANCLRIQNAYDDFPFGCAKIYVKKAALMRGACVNGIYEWKPFFERVAVACECLRSDTDKGIQR